MLPPTDIEICEDLELLIDIPTSCWAKLDFRAGKQSVCVNGFGDCLDSLQELALAGINIASDTGGFFRFEFDGEPECWRWTFSSLRLPANKFCTRVLVEWFPDTDQPVWTEKGDYRFERPNTPGKRLLDVWCHSDKLSKAIQTALHRLVDDDNEEIEKRWGLPFPYRTLAALDTALDTPRRPRKKFDDVAAKMVVTEKGSE